MKSLIDIIQKNDYMYFKYDDNTNIKYPIKCHPLDDKTGRRYVKYIETDDENTYYIVDNEDELHIRLSSKDLSGCIFLIQINKVCCNIESIDFISSIFAEKVNFGGSTFKDYLSFQNTTFLKEVNFIGVNFTQEADFFEAKFNDKVNFDKTTFLDNASFTKAMFMDNVSFREAIFDEDCSFNWSDIQKDLTLQSCKANKLILISLNEKCKNKNFKLNLQHSKINEILYTNADIKQASSSDTFLILKNEALKNNDQKTALAFYEKEMNTYKNEVSGFDKFILYFEYTASYYGTKAYLPIFWILAINFLFVVIFLWIICPDILDIFSYSFLTYFTASLNPTKTIENIYGIKNQGIWEFINLLKNLLVATLIYETIKSFRKFSRKI